MESVRQATENDLNTIKKLWKEAFSDTDSFIKWNFENNYAEENTFVLEVNNEIASVVQIIPHTLVDGGEELSVAYIWGMLTAKKHQKKGYARKIFEYLFPELYKRGYDLSILTSAVGNMYEKFGYVKVCEAKRYKEPTAYSTASLDNIEELIGFLDRAYSIAVSGKKVYMKRDKAYWKRIIGDIAEASFGEIAVSDKGYALLYPDGDKYVAGEIIGDFGFMEIMDSMPVMVKIINDKKVSPEIFKEKDLYIKFPL